MPVHVMDFLSALSARVGHEPKAPLWVGSCTFLKSQFRRQQHHAAQQTFVLWRGMCHRRNVQLGNDQEVHGRPRVDVVEGEHLVVFIHFARRDLARDDFAKNAIGIGRHSQVIKKLNIHRLLFVHANPAQDDAIKEPH